jgi:hypothetical protein
VRFVASFVCVCTCVCACVCVPEDIRKRQNAKKQTHVTRSGSFPIDGVCFRRGRIVFLPYLNRLVRLHHHQRTRINQRYIFTSTYILFFFRPYFGDPHRTGRQSTKIYNTLHPAHTTTHTHLSGHEPGAGLVKLTSKDTRFRLE